MNPEVGGRVCIEIDGKKVHGTKVSPSEMVVDGGIYRVSCRGGFHNRSRKTLKLDDTPTSMSRWGISNFELIADPDDEQSYVCSITLDGLAIIAFRHLTDNERYISGSEADLKLLDAALSKWYPEPSFLGDGHVSPSGWIEWHVQWKPYGLTLEAFRAMVWGAS